MPTAAIDLSYNCRAPPLSPVLCAAMGREKQEVWDGGRPQCACRWVGMSSFPWRMTPRMQLPCLLLLWGNCLSFSSGEGTASRSGWGALSQGEFSLSPLWFVYWLIAPKDRTEKNMTLPYQFLKYLNYFFLPKSLASKTISIVNTLVLSLWKF